jgi:hypothetical protein
MPRIPFFASNHKRIICQRTLNISTYYIDRFLALHPRLVRVFNLAMSSPITNSPNNTLNPYPYPDGHHKTDPPFPPADDVPYPPLPFICGDQFEPDLLGPLVVPDDANSRSRARSIAGGHTRPSLYRVQFQGRDCVLKIVGAFPTLPCLQHA